VGVRFLLVGIIFSIALFISSYLFEPRDSSCPISQSVNLPLASIAKSGIMKIVYVVFFTFIDEVFNEKYYFVLYVFDRHECDYL
jgi:hypothetical protein